jgi:hypothetical protein
MTMDSSVIIVIGYEFHNMIRFLTKVVDLCTHPCVHTFTGFHPASDTFSNESHFVGKTTGILR